LDLRDLLQAKLVDLDKYAWLQSHEHAPPHTLLHDDCLTPLHQTNGDPHGLPWSKP
jgi:hypothetical protein